MIRLRKTRAAAIALLAGLDLFLLAGCAVSDGAGGYSTHVRIGLDYYEPRYGDYGGYGGWQPGYRVGPPRRDFDRGRPPPGGARDSRGYRPAPGAHPVPSIPSLPHPRLPRPPRLPGLPGLPR